MIGKAELEAELRRTGVVAVIRMTHAADLVSVARALAVGDVRLVEITMTVPDAIEVIRGAVRSLGDEAFIGAGTVLDAATASRAIDAGAAYIVGPCLVPEVIETCRRADRLVAPGALTPTEIVEAWSLGADVVKVFPGRVATPGYLADLRGPLPHIPLMPTGNVDLATTPEYIRAGAVAVGVGKALVDPDAVRAGDMARITAAARDFRRLVDEARSAS
jgi:2-dehydro-3-deoxyphosphogluconate aldolase / (4S)-4-hydroxy-2-oxoglutarate aldolase